MGLEQIFLQRGVRALFALIYKIALFRMFLLHMLLEPARLDSLVWTKGALIRFGTRMSHEMST